MSDETQGTSPGKLIVLGLLCAIIGGVGVIGYHHATRNKVRHEIGLSGGQLYKMYCARCHLDTAEGTSAYPSLLISEMDQASFTQRVQQGKESMPAFPELTNSECLDIRVYVESLKAPAVGTPTDSPAEPQ